MHDALAALVPHRAIRSRALLACFGITAALHTATVLLNTLLPLHVTALGGTKTQVGLLFSVTTLVGMVLRPAVGGWVDRRGARRVIGPGAILFFATSLAFHSAGTPAAVITLMIGIGVGASLISTPASVHVAEISPAAHRGEALGGVLILTTCGHSAIYGFAPLYALDRGQGVLLSWFFGVYAAWMITCRALLRGVSDRVGRAQVLVPAMVMLCGLRVPRAAPDGPIVRRGRTQPGERKLTALSDDHRARGRPCAVGRAGAGHRDDRRGLGRRHRHRLGRRRLRRRAGGLRPRVHGGGGDGRRGPSRLRYW